MIDAATSARLALLANGYNPIPLTGKKPRFERWPHHLTNPDEIAVWALSYPEASNTGVTCWHTPTIDIDIADQEAAEALEQLAFEQFGERGRLMIRVGMAPKRASPRKSRSWATASRWSCLAFIPTLANHIAGSAAIPPPSSMPCCPIATERRPRPF
jgi:hypothetical protein